MKKLSLIIFILIHEITIQKGINEELNINNIKSNNNDNYYSEKIKRTTRKLGLENKKTIEKEDYKKAFMTTIEQSLNDFNFHLFKKPEKENYMNNLLSQIYNNLVENEKDDIDINEAFKLYEPNKILKSAEEIMTKMGYPDLVEQITKEVVGEEQDNKEKNNKKIKKNKKDKNDINSDL